MQIFAYASLNELVNMGPLSGSVSSSALSSVAVHDDLDEADDDVTSPAVCQFTDPMGSSSVASMNTTVASLQ